MEPAPIEPPLLNLLPVVLRARDFRLYTQDGGRLVDLWQSGGRSILGHTPAGVSRELKNYTSRGLFSPLPHPQERRLVKALSRLIPGRAFRLYADRFSLTKALERAGFPPPAPSPPASSLPASFPAASFPDPAFSPPPPAVPALWRPFLEPETPVRDQDQAPILIPILPWPLSPWVLALKPALEDRFAPSQPISPVLLAAATRAVYDLVAAGPLGGRPVYPRINHALYGNTPGPANPWRRRGPYLVHASFTGTQPSPPRQFWETLFRNFLREGFLIPPDPAEPLILPGILSPGEEARLAALLLAACQD
jgi:hypothetical protein